MSYEQALTVATDTCMAHLQLKLGGTEGKDCFRYYLPLASPVWGLSIGGGGDVRNTWGDAAPTELHMDAELRGRFDTLGAAQVWLMKAVRAFPLINKGTVKWLRLRSGGMPTIGWDTYALPNDPGREVILFTVEAGLEVVFTCS
jgi:hypothetical protein